MCIAVVTDVVAAEISFQHRSWFIARDARTNQRVTSYIL